MKYLTKIFIQTLTGYLLVTSLVTSANATDSGNEVAEKIILGWIENVNLQPSGMKAKAKLDTGAKTSSIHAKNIEYFEKDGEDWVRFQFANNTKLSDQKYLSGKSKKVITIEAPLTRRALIKRHKHTSLERPVVELPFTLADNDYTAEFTLTDRSKFLYPVLLGRRFLKHVAVVDPGKTFLRTRSVALEDDDTDDAQVPDSTPGSAAESASDSMPKQQPQASAEPNGNVQPAKAPQQKAQQPQTTPSQPVPPSETAAPDTNKANDA